LLTRIIVWFSFSLSIFLVKSRWNAVLNCCTRRKNKRRERERCREKKRENREVGMSRESGQMGEEEAQ